MDISPRKDSYSPGDLSRPNSNPVQGGISVLLLGERERHKARLGNINASCTEVVMGWLCLFTFGFILFVWINYDGPGLKWRSRREGGWERSSD